MADDRIGVLRGLLSIVGLVAMAAMLLVVSAAVSYPLAGVVFLAITQGGNTEGMSGPVGLLFLMPWVVITFVLWIASLGLFARRRMRASREGATIRWAGDRDIQRERAAGAGSSLSLIHI